ncbi:substrate-binding domain-containing protein [Sorangium sp. So ce1153]|uniref:substrate-binding domain-containing protein n=1 Tax=Sorangium sp. So ce1153 TaxID=3133333 RepID=UPI003F634445
MKRDGTPRSCPTLLPAAALLGALTVAPTAAAQPAVPCSSLPSPVHITGSSAVKPFLAELAKVLSASTPPLSIVYQGQGSCAGVTAFFEGAPLSGAGLSYWDADTELLCDADLEGSPIDIAVSDVFATTCDPAFTTSSTVSDFAGPIQPMTFVVPNASTQESISAEAAYFVYGFGAASGVAPWTDERFIFQRNAGSGTQQMMAAAIRVPASRWRGAPATSSDDMRNLVAFSTDEERTIGVLGANVASESSSLLKVLAYQHYDQQCGYYPDSDPLKRDKRNVRDGHYAIWGPLHFLTHVNINTGDPLSDGAALVIDYLTGRKQPPAGLDLIKLEAQHHVVPECAMRVRRTEEMGPLASFMPTRSCWCYFDAVAGGGADCDRCDSDGDCPSHSPKCNFGYCEPQ